MSKKRPVKLPSNRMAVVKILRSKYPKKARLYEGEIHQMCQNLSENTYEEPVNDIYDYYAYEKVGQFMTGSPKKVLEDIKECRVGTESYFHRKFFEVDILDDDEPMIRKGVYPCRNRKCRSSKTKETTIKMVQKRSSDEGMSVIVTCRVCKKEYTVG